MLTPDYLNLIEFNDVVEIYNKLNIEITADIIKRVSEMGYITSTSKDQLEILLQTNGEEIFNEALEKTSMLSSETKKALKKIFEDMAKEDLKGYEELYEYREKPFKLSQTQFKILNDGLKATNRTLKNLTNTIAFNSEQMYVDAVDKAYMKVASGAFSYDTAISTTCQELADKGITLKDKKGRNVQLEVAVRRNVLSGIQQTANSINRDIEDDLGCDGYEVTAHIGARPSHAKYQGLQFAENKEDAEKYNIMWWQEEVESEIGIEPVSELWNDYNCRHSYFGIILGISEPQYTEQDLDDFRNAKVMYNGKEIPYYEATQKQRALENNIRKAKRSVQTLEKAGINATNQKSKLAKLQKEYKEFCKETGLEKDYSRLKVAKNTTNLKDVTQKYFSSGAKRGQNKMLMNFQENVESMKSHTIKPSLYKNTKVKKNIEKAQADIMKLYRKNKKENLAILKQDGSLIGRITTGTNKNVSPNISTYIKMLTGKENTLTAIHNHPENYSFSLTDIVTFNKIKSIKTMVVLTDDYKFYLQLGNGARYKDSNKMEKIYKMIEKNKKKNYNRFNDVEVRDLTNQEFFTKMGWLYEKEKN